TRDPNAARSHVAMNQSPAHACPTSGDPRSRAAHPLQRVAERATCADSSSARRNDLRHVDRKLASVHSDRAPIVVRFPNEMLFAPPAMTEYPKLAGQIDRGPPSIRWSPDRRAGDPCRPKVRADHPIDPRSDHLPIRSLVSEMDQDSLDQ